MLDIIEQAHSIESPPELSADMPIASASLPGTDAIAMNDYIIPTEAEFFQDDSLMEEDWDASDNTAIPPWDDSLDPDLYQALITSGSF